MEVKQTVWWRDKDQKFRAGILEQIGRKWVHVSYGESRLKKRKGEVNIWERAVKMYYFAYGSNLHMKQMHARCKGSTPVTRAYLPDYQLTFNGVADIVEKEGKCVEGALYTITKKDLVELDRYEGYPQLYDRVTLQVTGEDGQVYNAYVYVMVIKGNKKPSKPYFKTILDGYQHWGLPVEKLKSA